MIISPPKLRSEKFDNNNNVKQGRQIHVLLNCTYFKIQITLDVKKKGTLKLGMQFYKKINFNIQLLDLFYYCNC